MSFCSFSKDFDENAYTVIENRFISKYLPSADGFAVKVYLYGLFLCHNDGEFSISAMAEVLGASVDQIKDAFFLWEDYDLVSVLSKDPFVVQFLPVKTAVGKPKKARYEQYADFNKELGRKMQQVNKFLTANDFLKYMHFLQETDMQPAALLLIVDYCISKQGEDVSPSYVFNKAKKFVKNGWITYEQVDCELVGCNVYESDVSAVFTALKIARKADETDYALYRTWVETLGFDKGTIVAVAKQLKKPTVTALDLTLNELSKQGKIEKAAVQEYLAERETLISVTFHVANKLGASVPNPAAYAEEYTKKWWDCGYEESSLLQIARYCLRTDCNKFSDMDQTVARLFEQGVVSADSVKAYLKVKNDELDLFMKIQGVCGSLRKSTANLAFVETWRNWNFNESMILEAAKRASTSSNPIPYMNKILSDWKRGGIFVVTDIPDHAPVERAKTTPSLNDSVQAINEKTLRERFYSERRERAERSAEKYLAKANENARFKEVSLALSKMEIALAKAEIFEPKNLPSLKEEQELLIVERKELLKSMGLTESKLTPQYECKKCSDTGYTKSGTACDCYKK